MHDDDPQHREEPPTAPYSPPPAFGAGPSGPGYPGSAYGGSPYVSSFEPGPFAPGSWAPGGSSAYPGGSNTYPGRSNTYPGGSNTYPGGSNTYPGGYAPPPPAGGRRGLRRGLGASMLVAAVVGAAVGALTVAVADDNNSSSAGLSFSNQAAPAVKVDGSVSDAAAKIEPSVVTINVTSGQELDTGSGVLIRADGYILTNNHVISAASGGGSIAVTLKDGRRTAASVVGADPSDDLAVVKVALTGLPAATFSSSAALVVGQTVVAVGAPLGLSDTVTSGIVSNTARPVSTGSSAQNSAVFNAVQTDAAINPGNSGGPLVNLNGAVVGINAAIATDQSQGGLQVPGQSGQAGNIGIGFAIGSDEASRIAAELISTGKATHAVIGVSVSDPAATATGPTGAVVKTVTAGGPASKAGLQVGDLVTKVGDQLIDGSDALVAAIRSHAPGATVTLTFVRGGGTQTAKITLGSSG